MKKRNFFPLALAALMLAGCSSDKIDDGGNGGNGTDATTKGYIKVSINLPTRTVTTSRTGSENDQYDDGEAYEYKVNNAHLLIFKKSGTSQADYTFNSVYALNDAFTVGKDNDAITEQGQTTVKVKEDVGESAKYYGLVVLNGNSVVKFDDSANTVSLNGTDMTTSTTFSDFMKASSTTATDAVVYTGTNKDDFFMTNAILNAKSGAGSEAPTGLAQTLVPLEGKIKPTEAEAVAAQTDFFVERAVAKVEVGKSSTQSETGLTVGTTKLDYEILGWELGNVNTYTYVVRNWGLVDNVDATDYTKNAGDGWLSLKSPAAGTSTTNPYRFVGTALQKEDTGDPASDWYRTYFGYDPNFTGFDGLSGSPEAIADDATGVKYCLENTFDVAHQTIQHTTCAVIKVKLTGFPTDNSYDWNAGNSTSSSGKTFYIQDENRTNILDYNAMCKVFVNYAQNLYKEEILTKAGGSSSTTVTISGATVKFGTNVDNKKQITDITWNVSGSTTTTVSLSSLEEADKTDKKDAVNKGVKVYEYKDAVAYYRVPIKHFGDKLTPWSRYVGDGTSGDAKGVSYPDNDANRYLGRYGVLRNNWYVLSIEGLNQVGNVTIPDISKDLTPDDELENWISCKVNVLSWAKRTQGVTLK